MSDTTEKNVFMDRYLTPIAVLLGAVIIAGAFIFWGHTGTQPAGTNGQPAAVAVDISKVKTTGNPYIGSASAPVTMALWFDYQCPFCKQFDQTVVSQLITNYVNSGKLRIVFKDFQFLGQDSTVASEFGRAMWEAYPDKYPDWYKAMFAAQDEEGDQGFGDLASIQKLTATIPGVDVTKVTNLMNQKKAQYDAAIAADRAEGASYGIQGTPSVIVGKTLLQGGQTYETVAALIDAQLKK